MTTQMNLFAIDDNDKSLRSPAGGYFGLNTGYITKFEFNENAGKDNSPTDAVDINITVNGKEYRRRLFEPSDVLYYRNTQVHKGEPDYEKAYIEDIRTKVAIIKHALKALGVSEQAIKNTSDTLVSVSIAEGFKKLCSLVPKDYKSKPVDVFLEYQYNIQGDNDKTYLEIPKNFKGGDFLVSHQKPSKGEWVATISDKGQLNYVDSNGMVHTFERNSKFMNSSKAKEQVVASIFDNNNNNTTQQQQQPAQPVASTW